MNPMIMKGIVDVLANEGPPHGSFVTFMAGGNYGQAARRADSDNLAAFGQLVLFRENLDTYGLDWGRSQVIERQAELAAEAIGYRPMGAHE